MPIQVQGPDGQLLEFPDGTPRETMRAAMQKRYASPQADFSGVEGGVTGSTYDRPQRTLPEIASRSAGLTGRALAQGVGGLVDTIAQGAKSSPVLLPGRLALAALGTDYPDLDTRGAIEQGLTSAGVPQYEGPTERVIGGVGEALTGAGLTAGVGGLPRAGLQAASAAGGAGAGGITRELGGSPRLQVLASLLGGLAPGAAMGRGARMPQSPEAQALVTQAAQRGIPIRPVGVKQGKVGQTLRGVPGTGAGKRYETDVLKANDALAETIGAPRGTPPARVYPEAFKRNSAEYDQFAKTYPLDLDDKTITRLAEYRNSAPKLGGAESPAVRAIDEFLGEVEKLGTREVPGDLFKRLDTELGQVPYDSVSSRALETLKKQLRQQYKATMPKEDAARWDDLMRRYGDMKTVEPLYAKLAQTGGRVDPRQILARINATKAGRTRMAKGERGELGELANIGQAIQPPMPISPAAVGLGGAGLGAGALVSAPGSAGLYGLLNLAGRAADRAYLPQGNRLQTLGQGIPGILPALAPFRFDQEPQ